ncbi:MAG: DUF11 domain-containing protein [Methanobrevibacter sp.]|uniref:hypothetical protein n=1 Tax=Methanobrevibacter sp. TaxID=66852 RepID=UPI0025CC7C25|nr:hypothetical protein [Methanobrevibacter sp.]MBQ8018450.1 DUF11 domain-containing protein [Methanobrevibacter sp.]
MGVVSASQDSAMNNMTLTKTDDDVIYESLPSDSAEGYLQASDNELLSATHDISGSTVQDIKNYFDSGAVHEGDTVYLGNKDFTSNWQQWDGNQVNVNVANVIITGGSSSNPNGFSTINANYAKVFSFNAAGITLSNVKILNSNSGSGPGSAVYVQSSDCKINNCLFDNCENQNGGAVRINSQGTNTQFTNCNFTNNGNKWTGDGGAVYVEANDCKFNNCLFEKNNYARSNNEIANGGAIFSTGARLTVTNSYFKQNVARSEWGNGGAICSKGADSTISNCTFEDNSAPYGKAIHCEGTNGLVDDCKFRQNIEMSVESGFLSLTFALSVDFSHMINGNPAIENLKIWDGSSYVPGNLTDEGVVKLPNQELTVVIYDSNGDEIDRKTGVTDKNGEMKYDYSNLPDGSYTYKVYSGELEKEGSFFKGSIPVEGNRFSDIQAAINSAEPGTILQLKDVTYINDIQNNMVIDKSITILGSNGTVLDAEGYSRIFKINDNVNTVNLVNLTFINGKSKENGGAIYIGENCDNVNILNSNFTNNHVANDGSQQWPDNFGHGGAVAISASAHNGLISDSTFTNNSAPAGGGAVKNFGAQGWVISNSTFTNNTAYGVLQNNPSLVPNGGGALWSCMAQMEIFNCNFTENKAPYGGAIRGFVDTFDCQFYFNVATNGNGGAIDVTIDSQVGRPNLKFVNTTFVNNTAKGQRSQDRAQGGALHMYDINHVDMIGCKCFNNTADRGGAIDFFIIGTTVVDNCILENNTAHSEGGAFYINTTSSPCEFMNSNISNNKAGTDGGAIYLITDGAFFDNIISVNNNASRGGSAFIRGHDAVVQHSTFNNNNAIYNGTDNSGIGGAFDILGNNCQLIDVTSKYNNATLGGSTFIRGDHTKIKQSTFDNNTATLRGGGINVAGDYCNVSDVDVSGNFAGTDGGAVYVKGDYSSFVRVDSINNTACRGGSTFIEGDFVDVHDCVLDGNKAIDNGTNLSGRGGGLDIAGENCKIYNLEVSKNTAAREGGAFYVKSNDIHFHHINSTDNSAQRGGSSYIRGNNITVSDSTFDRNKAIYNGTNDTGLGGALDVLGNDCKFINVESLNNNATLGGSTFIRGNNTLIKDCVLDNNYATERGGGLDIAGINCTVINVDLSNNHADGIGGAVYVLGDNATFDHVDSERNTATRGGSSFIEGNFTKIIDCDLDNNNASDRGGSLDIAGNNCTVRNVNLSNCHAANEGGAIYVKGNFTTFDNVMSVNNTASKGGSSFIEGHNITVQNCHLDSNNASIRGGGLDVAGDNCTFINVTLSNCNATINGGAVYVRGDNALFDNVTSFKNTALAGGSSYIDGNNVIVQNSRFKYNTALKIEEDPETGLGGAINIEGDNAQFLNNNVSYNEANSGGGVFIIGENALFMNNNLTFNRATGRNSAGGAASIEGANTNFTKNNISSNYAADNGGGVFVASENAYFEDIYAFNNTAENGGFAKLFFAFDLIVKNSTFISNHAIGDISRDRGEGGAFHIDFSFDADIQANFYNNTATNGSAIYIQDSSVRVHDSEFFDNLARSYLLVIDYDRGNSSADCTVQGVCNCSCNCSKNKSLIQSYALNRISKENRLYAKYLNNLLRAYDAECECACGCDGNCTEGTCNCHCNDLQYISTVYEGENITILVFHKGGDNIANAMYNRDGEVTVNNITYQFFDENNEVRTIHSKAEDVEPEDIPNYDNVYQYPFENNQVIRIEVYNETGSLIKNVTYSEIPRTDIYGATRLTLENLTKGNYTVKAIYDKSSYYTVIGNQSKFRVIPLIVKMVDKVTLNETVILGDNVSFTIIVNNTNVFALHNVTVTEIFNSGELQFVGYTNHDKWITKDNITFVYNGVLGVNESASFTITFKTLKTGTLLNTVNLTTKETGNRTDSANNTTTVYNPNMTVEKVSLNVTDFVVVNDTVAFNVTVTNVGDCTLGKVNVTEEFDAGDFKFIKIVGENWTASNDNRTFFYANDLVEGGNATFTVYFKVLRNGSLPNNVTARSNRTDKINASANIRVYLPDMAVEKLTLNETVRVDEQVVFTIVVTNTGDCDLANVSVVEEIPIGLAYNSFVGDGWIKVGDYIFNYTSVLAPGNSTSFNITFDAREGGHWRNVVVVSSDLTEDKVAENVTFVEDPSLEAFKLALNETVYLGNDTYFVIVVKNTGNCVLHDVRVFELFNSSELNYTNHNKQDLWIKEGNAFRFNGTLAVNESVNFTVWFKTLVKGNVTNTVNVTSEETENITVENTTYVLNPDIAVEKLALDRTVYIGDDTRFTIVVKNIGDCNLTNIRVFEIYNATELDSITLISGENWTQSGNVFSFDGILAAGSTSNFTVKFTTKSLGNITNTVNVTSGQTGNRTAYNNTSVLNKFCDLEVTKGVNATSIFVNDTVEWTITVKNKGPHTAKNVTVSDYLPEGVVVSGTIPNGGKQTGRTIVWNLGDLEANSEISFTFTTKVVAEKNATNIVVVNSTTPDSNRSNNKANNTTYANPVCDLKITKSVNATSIFVNDTVLWTITVVNVGPSAAKDVVVNDTIPDGLEFATPEGCTFDGKYLIWNIKTLDANASVTLKLITKVVREGNVNNTVVVNSTTPDSNESNNRANNTTYANPICDLEITKYVNATSVYVNDMVEWTIIVFNKGPSSAVGVVVNDALPDGLQIIKATPSVGSFDNKTRVWEIEKIDVNDSVSLTLVTKIKYEKSFTNIVTVNSTTPDSNESNNHAQNTTIANPICDLEISKFVNASSVNVGDVVKWTISVSNNGPSTAKDVIVNDTLPDGVRLLEVPEGCSQKGNVLIWNIGSLDANASVSITLLTQVLTEGTKTNIAVVTGSTPDSNESNNHAQNTTVVNPVCDLEIIKLVSSKKAYVGEELTWTIIVINHGPSTAKDVKVQENIPDSLQYKQYTATKGTYDKNSQIWTIGDMNNASTVTLTIVTKVLNIGNITNPVEVSTSTFDNNSNNNKAENRTEAFAVCDLELIKSSDRKVYRVGDEMHWIITVVNHGPSTAKDVVVNDVLPSGVKFISYTATKGSYAQSSGKWDIGDVENGEKYVLDILCKVMVAGDIVNKANVTSSTNDTDLSNNYDDAEISVIENKTPDDHHKPHPRPVNPTPEPAMDITMKNTGNPFVYLLVAIFAIFGCFWTSRKE